MAEPTPVAAAVPRSASESLLAGFVLLAIAVFAGNGANPWLSPLVALALLLCLRGVSITGDAHGVRPRWLAAALIVSTIVGLIRAPGAYLGPSFTRPALALIAVALCAVALAGMARPRRARAALAALLALHLVAGALLLRWSPRPAIDVFFAEEEGAAALLDGINPYAITFTNPYPAELSTEFLGRALPALEHYPYPPASLLATTLAHAALGDVRYAMLAAQLATAALLFALATRRGRRPDEALALAALSLLHPRALFFLEQAWTEPLLGACWVALLLALTSIAADTPSRRSLITVGVALGAFLAMKQYAVILSPLLLRDRALRRPLPLLVALATGALITLPFLAWNPSAFIDDVLLFQVRQPFRMDALSLAALFARITSIQPPAWLSFAAAAAAIAWAFRRGSGGVAGIAVAAVIVLGAFFVVAKQAFANYYAFVGIAMLCAIAARRAPADD